MTRAMSYMAAAVATMMIAGKAQAASYSISLSGTDAGFTESQFNFNGGHYDSFYQPLTGLDSTNSITVSQGDTVDATVTLDGLYTIPASPQHTDFLLYLFGSNFPAGNTGVNGTFTFFNGSTPGPSFAYTSTTSSQLSNYAAIFPPNNGPITFDSFTDNFTIGTLGSPATLDGSALSYAIVSAAAVPEPASWALMIGGLGLAGAVLRRRRSAAVTA